MNIFGFTIGRTPRATPVQRTLSPEALAWLSSSAPPSTPILSNAYQQVVWVYRAINAIAEQVANIPFRFSSKAPGSEHVITSGPLIDFYDRPHPHINRFQYWELRVIWLMLRGECFRIPLFEDQSQLRIKNSKLKIVILDPSRFQHIVEDNRLIGWRYIDHSLNTPLSSQVFLPEEVWHEKLPNPFDFWRGMPPLANKLPAASVARPIEVP
jgi:phage portal protein BeeE